MHLNLNHDGVSWDFLVIRPELAGQGAVVFLPSVLSPAVQQRRIFPYWPRQSWQGDYPDQAVVYVADPMLTEGYFDIGGSWFLHQRKGSLLPDLLMLLRERVLNTDAHAVYAGSSLGGYAALVLNFLDPRSAAYAEMPQVILERHPDAAQCLKRLEAERPGFQQEFLRYCDLCTQPEPMRAMFLCRTRVSDIWTVQNHVAPLLLATQRWSAAAHRFQFTFEEPGDGQRGHAAFERATALTWIAGQLRHAHSRPEETS